jgi:hypothetical protein
MPFTRLSSPTPRCSTLLPFAIVTILPLSRLGPPESPDGWLQGVRSDQQLEPAVCGHELSEGQL